MKYCLLVIVIFSCCENMTKEKEEKCPSKTQFINSFYNAILDYQKNNSLPDTVFSFFYNKNMSKQSSLKYIYIVKVFNDIDSTVTISLNPSGLNRLSENNIYGVYYDKCLKPTCVMTTSNSNTYFLSEKLKKNLDFFYDNSLDAIDILYPTYVYTFRNGTLFLKEKEKGNIGQ